MDWKQIGQTAADVAVQSGLVAAVGVAVIAWVRKHLAADKPAWLKYEGLVVGAIRAAEKAIPDNTPNKGAAKLDFAMREFLKSYDRATGAAPSQSLLDIVRHDAVPLLVERLEAAGTLRKGAVPFGGV